MDNEVIQQQLESLPKEIRSVLESTPWRDLVKKIAEKEGLDSEKTSKLETEVLLVLYGFLPEEELLVNIASKVGTGIELAQKIEESIAKEIFEELDRKYAEVTNQAPEKRGATEDSVSVAQENNVPEIISHNLPMVERGEVAHEVPHIEPTTDDRRPTTATQPTNQEVPKTSIPHRYEAGKDPYREPLV